MTRSPVACEIKSKCSEERRHLASRAITLCVGHSQSTKSITQGLNVPVLFLDFDGVLHREFCHPSRHFECEAVFASAIYGLDVEVVVSSAWRLGRELKEVMALLSDSVASRIVGMTPRYSQLPDIPSKLALYEREAECAAWLSANRPAYTRWIAADDRPWLFRPFCSNLFLVDGKRGLDEHSSQLLRAMLNELSR